ncbi:IS110 family transposase [Actinopolymorpha sp. B9G3]|uniref:IS110 family transposase n=1 Tax=Actinopolymorpha sp. B9G3 TaxID=3158970 RepID=UPI0032D93C74
MTDVIIGVDPHKLSATIEVVDSDGGLLGSGRFTTDQAGYAAMRAYVKAWPDRVWAVEGANGAGRPLAQRLLAAGERVLDVPAKLAARVRLFDTGHNRKTDALDAHSIAMVAVRTPGLRRLTPDGDLEAIRMLADRRDELAHQRVQTLNRLQRLLSELIPGQRKRDLSALQAKTMLGTVRPRDIAGKTRRRMAAEELADLVAVGKKLKKIKAELKTAVETRGSTLMEVHGIGPAGAARILADVGDIARFADRNRFASWTGTAPMDASSGEQIRHRLSRAGNRQMNHVIHIAAIVQLRHDTEGRAYYRRKLAAGKTPLEALRCLKRRLSDVIYRHLVTDAQTTEDRAAETGPGGHCGATLQSSAVDLPPHIDTSDQPLPGPATPTLRRPTRSRKRSSPNTLEPRPLTQRGARSGRHAPLAAAGRPASSAEYRFAPTRSYSR